MSTFHKSKEKNKKLIN